MLYSRIFKSLVIFGYYYLWILGFITFRFSLQNVSVWICKRHFIYSLILQTISTALFPCLAFETIKNVGFFTEPIVVYLSTISFIFRTLAIVIIVAISFYIQSALCIIIKRVLEIISKLPKFDIDRNSFLILVVKISNYVGKLSLQFYLSTKAPKDGQNFIIILGCLERFIECTVLDIFSVAYILGLLIVRRIIQLINEYLSSAAESFHVTTKPAMRKTSVIQIRLALVQYIEVQKDVYKMASRFHEILQVQMLLSTASSFFNIFCFCYFFYYAKAALNRPNDVSWDASTKAAMGIFFQFMDLLILAKIAEDTVESYGRMRDVLFRVSPMMGIDAKLDEIVCLIG